MQYNDASIWRGALPEIYISVCARVNPCVACAYCLQMESASDLNGPPHAECSKYSSQRVGALDHLCRFPGIVDGGGGGVRNTVRRTSNEINNRRSIGRTLAERERAIKTAAKV